MHLLLGRVVLSLGISSRISCTSRESNNAWSGNIDGIWNGANRIESSAYVQECLTVDLQDLHLRWSRIKSNKISVFAQNVTRHFDHVFMTSRCLKCFEGDLRGIALHVISIDDHLNDSIPDLEGRSLVDSSRTRVSPLRKRNHQRCESTSAWYPNTTCNRPHISRWE